MNEMFRQSLFAGVTISLIAYEIGLFLKRKLGLAILNPLLVSIVIVILALKVFGISKVAWLTDPKMTLPILVVLSIWKGLGYRVIIFLAGLQNIDQRYYLAARMDGAKSIKRFWHVTLPQLRPTIFFLSVTTIIDVFKTFDEVYIMYGNEAGPLKSGLTIVYYIFTKFYRHWEFSSAAAAAFILFLIILCITLAQFVIVKVYRLCKEARDCE